MHRTVELCYDATEYIYMCCGFDGMAALHVYTLILNLNWDNSYMVSSVWMASLLLTMCVKLQTRSGRLTLILAFLLCARRLLTQRYF